MKYNIRKLLGENFIKKNKLDELIPSKENKYSKIVHEIKERKMRALGENNRVLKRAFSEVVNYIETQNKK